MLTFHLLYFHTTLNIKTEYARRHVSSWYQVICGWFIYFSKGNKEAQADVHLHAVIQLWLDGGRSTPKPIHDQIRCFAPPKEFEFDFFSFAAEIYDRWRLLLGNLLRYSRSWGCLWLRTVQLAGYWSCYQPRNLWARVWCVTVAHHLTPPPHPRCLFESLIHSLLFGFQQAWSKVAWSLCLTKTIQMVDVWSRLHPL